MASTILTSFFTKAGVPQSGLSPTIRIWEVTNISEILIVGDPDGTMVEVSASGSPGGSNSGFYKFVFTDALGYNLTKTYLVRTDGGSTLPDAERYQKATIDSALPLLQIDVTNILDVVDEIRKYSANRTFIDENNQLMGLGIVGTLFIDYDSLKVSFCSSSEDLANNIEKLKKAGINPQPRPKGKY